MRLTGGYPRIKKMTKLRSLLRIKELSIVLSFKPGGQYMALRVSAAASNSARLTSTFLVHSASSFPSSLYFLHEADANLKQNEAQSGRAESEHKGVNQRSKDVTQVQQRQR